jgi:hypothetical protein
MAAGAGASVDGGAGGGGGGGDSSGPSSSSSSSGGRILRGECPLVSLGLWSSRSAQSGAAQGVPVRKRLW